ncbi:MAG TPA: hypothetical protein VG347_11645 [Verrucomicrobiae bacterium]|nr:hypothetical protein [Verrucomicrobiae bacterium]
MNVTHTLGALKKFRRTPWRFQQTVELPGVADRDRFVSVILAALDPLESATVTIDAVIFNTEKTLPLCPVGSALTHDTTITAQPAEIQALLLAAFWDGFDFICVPTPKPSVFYADHDDWITFYANTKSNLNRVIDPLKVGGYKIVPEWQRKLQHAVRQPV